MELDEIFSRMRDHLSVTRAFGTAYEQDGATIVPVALVAGGGGGEGTSSPAGADHAAGNGPSGSGGGFGGVVVPVGVYVVRDDQVRWVPAVNPNLAFLVAIVALRLAARVIRRRSR